VPFGTFQAARFLRFFRFLFLALVLPFSAAEPCLAGDLSFEINCFYFDAPLDWSKNLNYVPNQGLDVSPDDKYFVVFNTENWQFGLNPLFRTDISFFAPHSWSIAEDWNVRSEIPHQGTNPANHGGAGCYWNGYLYDPVQFYNGHWGASTNIYINVYGTNAALLSCTNIYGALGNGPGECSAVCMDTNYFGRPLLFAVSFLTNRVWEYNVVNGTNLVYVRTLNTTFNFQLCQGVAWDAASNIFYLMCDMSPQGVNDHAGYLYTMTTNGAVNFQARLTVPNECEWEGISASDVNCGGIAAYLIHGGGGLANAPTSLLLSCLATNRIVPGKPALYISNNVVMRVN
jgi:hypothetical protein